MDLLTVYAYETWYVAKNDTRSVYDFLFNIETSTMKTMLWMISRKILQVFATLI